MIIALIGKFVEYAASRCAARHKIEGGVVALREFA